MNRLKFVLAAMLLGVALVLPAATPAHATACSMGANPLPFNTCTTPIACTAPTVTVTVTMTGAGSVTGTAICGMPPGATCTAFGPPGTPCTATGPAFTGFLTCGATVTGVVPIWSVTCSNP